MALPSSGPDVEEGAGVSGAGEAGDGEGDAAGDSDPEAGASGAPPGASPHAVPPTARPQRRDRAASPMPATLMRG